MGSLPRPDAKLLYRRLDSLFGALDLRRSQKQVVESFLEEFYKTVSDHLRLRAAALYTEQRDGFDLIREIGEAGVPLAETLDPAVPPLSLIFQHRVYIFSDPGGDGRPWLQPVGPLAGVVIGRRPSRQVLFFLVADGWIREELDFTLNTVRAALGSRLMEERVRGSFREAAEIQQSLLLEEPPSFRGFDIAARSVPAEEVGGDFFDFLPLEEELLGVAVGDASGHGLPAALLVRDVVTGMRMGIEKDLKMTHALMRLNRVIHRSNLSSRFVSVFYGELAAEGDLIYVNAGHQPPLLFHRGGVSELKTGGTVIGPLPEAEYRRGVARLEPGDLLVVCTDGILERRNARGEFFGEEGLQAEVRSAGGASAEELVDRLFGATAAYGQGRPWEDDATLVVIRRLE
jgi:sigma-B regulation protein RsbU (phosphoserine phosphatase)